MAIFLKIFVMLSGIVLLLKSIGLWPVVRHVLGRWVYEAVMGRPRVNPRQTPPSHADAELCYRLLGLSPSASWAEIQSAYRRKAKVHHPDHGGDEDAMRALNEAYQALKRMKKG